MTGRGFKFWNAAVLLCAVLIVATALPRAASFLHDDEHARWIRASQPHLDLRGQPDLPLVTFFRTTVETPRSGSPAKVHCESRNTLRLIVDGREVQLEPDPRGGASTTLARDGARHELFFRVDSRLIPPLLKVDAPEAGLFSDSTWQCSSDGQEWRPVRLASDPAIADQALQVPGAWSVLARYCPYLLLGLILASGCWWMACRTPAHGSSRVPGCVRWILVCALSGLAIHNWSRLPAGLGMDSSAHLEYIDFILQKGRLPQAYEGFEANQAPLYYLLRAGLHPSEHAYRLVALLCLILQVEVVHRIMRALFPGDACGQCVGLILGSTVPMSV